MIDRLLLGTVAKKPHTILRGPDNALRYEECFTRHGFDGAYSIAYHERSPAIDESLEPSRRGWAKPEFGEPSAIRRLFLGKKIGGGGKPLDARQVLLGNADVQVAIAHPSENDDSFLANNDGDDLYYFHEGSASLQTPFGSLDVGPGDYVWVPRSLPHRFLRVLGPTLWLHLEIRKGLRLPAQYLNPHGQLRMDAPYSHRDFRRPTELPRDDSATSVIIKRGDRFFERRFGASLLDVVGLDGFVYPVAFNIENFQPKTGLVHLPPPVHATFAASGLVICSFVPRLTDTHPEAIPCPYPHSSVDCDEFIFYCRGNFTSRRDVGPGAMSLHPAGTPHGPHPGAYEASIGAKETTELAVMLDTFAPLLATKAAAAIEEDSYHAAWRA